MIINYPIKCEVCESTICTKIQVGWLKKYPIRIHCPECNILISGEVFQNQEKMKVDISLKNAQHVSPSVEMKYFIEISGELLTSKIREFRNTDIISLSPFIRAILLDIEKKKLGTEIFKKKLIHFCIL